MLPRARRLDAPPGGSTPRLGRGRMARFPQASGVLLLLLLLALGVTPRLVAGGGYIRDQLSAPWPTDGQHRSVRYHSTIANTLGKYQAEAAVSVGESIIAPVLVSRQNLYFFAHSARFGVVDGTTFTDGFSFVYSTDERSVASGGMYLAEEVETTRIANTTRHNETVTNLALFLPVTASGKTTVSMYRVHPTQALLTSYVPEEAWIYPDDDWDNNDLGTTHGGGILIKNSTYVFGTYGDNPRLHNKVYALDALTGALRWSFPSNSTIGDSPFSVLRWGVHARPATDDDRGILFIRAGHDVFALDAASGTYLWNVTLDMCDELAESGVDGLEDENTRVTGGITVDTDREIAYVSTPTCIYRVDYHSLRYGGRIRDKYSFSDTDKGSDYAPTAALGPDGRVYLGFGNEVFSLKAKRHKGKIKKVWKSALKRTDTQTSADIIAPVIILGDEYLVQILDTDAQLYFFKLADGKQAKQLTLSTTDLIEGLTASVDAKGNLLLPVQDTLAVYGNSKGGCDTGYEPNTNVTYANPDLCLECQPGYHKDEVGGKECKKCDSGEWRDEYRATFCYACEQNKWCVGGLDCAIGRAGPACVDCADNYFHINDRCEECPKEGSALIGVAGVLVFLLLLLLIFKYSGVSAYASATQFLQEVQEGDKISVRIPGRLQPVMRQVKTVRHDFYIEVDEPFGNKYPVTKARFSIQRRRYHGVTRFHTGTGLVNIPADPNGKSVAAHLCRDVWSGIKYFYRWLLDKPLEHDRQEDGDEVDARYQDEPVERTEIMADGSLRTVILRDEQSCDDEEQQRDVDRKKSVMAALEDTRKPSERILLEDRKENEEEAAVVEDDARAEPMTAQPAGEVELTVQNMPTSALALEDAEQMSTALTTTHGDDALTASLGAELALGAENDEGNGADDTPATPPPPEEERRQKQRSASKMLHRSSGGGFLGALFRSKRTPGRSVVAKSSSDKGDKNPAASEPAETSAQEAARDSSGPAGALELTTFAEGAIPIGADGPEILTEGGNEQEEVRTRAEAETHEEEDEEHQDTEEVTIERWGEEEEEEVEQNAAANDAQQDGVQSTTRARPRLWPGAESMQSVARGLGQTKQSSTMLQSTNDVNDLAGISSRDLSMKENFTPSETATTGDVDTVDDDASDWDEGNLANDEEDPDAVHLQDVNRRRCYCWPENEDAVQMRIRQREAKGVYGRPTSGLQIFATAFVIGVTYVQSTALFMQFRLPWPPYVRKYLSYIGSIFSFNIPDLMTAPECEWDLTYTEKWYMSVSLPFVVLLLFWLLYMYSYTYQNPRDQRAIQDKCVQAVLILTTIFYVYVTAKALEPLDCPRQPDGTRVMDAQPQIECTFLEGEYALISALSVLTMMLYGGGALIALIVVLQRAKEKKMMSDPSFISKFGWLFMRYNREFYYWEVLVLLRKLALVGVGMWQSQDPRAQAYYSIGVLSAALVLQAYNRPFICYNCIKQRKMRCRCWSASDQLESGLLVGLILVLALGVVAKNSRKDKEAAGIVIGVLLIGGLVGLVAVLFHAARRNKREQRWLQEEGHDGGGNQRAVHTFQGGLSLLR